TADIAGLWPDMDLADYVLSMLALPSTNFPDSRDTQLSIKGRPRSATMGLSRRGVLNCQIQGLRRQPKFWRLICGNSTPSSEEPDHPPVEIWLTLLPFKTSIWICPSISQITLMTRIATRSFSMPS